MTEISKIDIDDNKIMDIQVSGHDLQSLLFAYMDSLLDQFTLERFYTFSLNHFFNSTYFFY